MATNVSVSNRRISSAPPRQQLGLPVILLALAMAVAGVAGARLFDFPPLQVAVIPAILCAFARPQVFLLLAVAFIPYTFSLANGGDPATTSALKATGSAVAAATPSGGGLGAEFGISDLLLLMAFPGLIAKAISQPSRIRLASMTIPILLYLGVGLLSFIVNLPLMHGALLSFFFAYARSFQIVLLIPIVFMAVEWTPNELRGLIRAYLYGVFVLAVYGIISFALGQRAGLYILGNHKNGVGLALAFATLITVAALTQPPGIATKPEQVLEPELLNINRRFLLACAVLFPVALLCSLSRGSVLCTFIGLFFLSVLRRRGRIFGVVLALASVGFLGLIYVLPEKEADYVSNYSTDNYNNHTRIDQSLAAWKRFEANPLLGDGYRTRKEILPHNLEATLLGETGALGLLTFFWMFFIQMKFFARARKLFSGDPLRETLIIAFSSCAVAIMVHAQFDPYWRRGPLWIPWIGVGVVGVMALQESRARRRVRAAEQAEQNLIWRAKRAERATRRQAEMAGRHAALNPRPGDSGANA